MSYSSKFQEIEAFAKELWEKNNVNKVLINENKEPKIVLDFFPYPSGIGLHVGHTLGYIASDIYARYHRLRGKNVLYAMGFDSFGLPAEQFAIETGVHPEITTMQNISNMKEQLDILGLMHDKDRSFSTTDDNYYKWTQWIFLKLYNSYFDKEANKAFPISRLEKKLQEQNLSKEEIYKILQDNRLAYLDDVEVNWCPKLGTVLSHEEVINGKSERGNHSVFKKKLKQWVLRITNYANRLLENLDELGWPISVKEMQRNWIGLSSGHEITFFECILEKTISEIKVEPFLVADIPQAVHEVKKEENNPIELTVFSTKVETISCATFCAVSINHPDIVRLCRTSVARNFLSTYKEGSQEFESVFTGTYVYNPINKRKMPVYIADYVLAYGTRAVMGVPEYDERDKKLALAHGLDIIPLAESNLPVEEIVLRLEQNDFIKKKSNMKLRDWIFSRQRYWGEPFPIVIDKNGNAYSLEEHVLPIKLPKLEDFTNSGADNEEILKPLDKLPEWKNVNFIKLDLHTARIVEASAGSLLEIDGAKYLVESGSRETNTMPNWAGSCWYYLRYMDVHNDDAFASLQAQKYWSGEKLGCVDLYLGGAEHAVLHLLYARFWHMVLYDLGYVLNKEPFDKLVNQGMILGASYQDLEGKYYAPNAVEKKGNQWFLKNTNQEVIEKIGKIGKRYKNGVPPQEVTKIYSVDAFRLYMMYLGPLEQNKAWNYTAIKGMLRFLEKICAIEVFNNSAKPDDEGNDQENGQAMLYDFYKMLEKVEHDCEALKFHTAISSMIIFVNAYSQMSEELYIKLITILAPFAPHLCEYLASRHGINGSIFNQTWPVMQKIEHKIEEVNIVFALNGKKKYVQSFPANVDENVLKAKANEISAGAKNIIIIRDKNMLPKLVNIVL